MSTVPACSSCFASGEVPTDYGAVDCPDCGGAGFLPSRHVLVDWRVRDFEQAVSRGDGLGPSDLKWMLTELRQARAALMEIIALAHDIDDGDAIAQRIRFVANKALGLYEVSAAERPGHEAGAALVPRAVTCQAPRATSAAPAQSEPGGEPGHLP